MKKIDIVTLFPESVASYLSASLLGKAVTKKILKIRAINIRDFAEGKHKVTDLPPYGGGPGMVLKPEPIWKAVRAIQKQNKKVKGKNKTQIILFSLRGKKFTQKEADRMAQILGMHEFQNSYFVIDNNQSYSTDECFLILKILKQESVLDRMLFIEQPCKRGEEPKNLATYFDSLGNIRVALDESIASSADIERINKKCKNISSLIIIPKIEKGGIIELWKMIKMCDELGITMSPSTLTGPPPQLSQYIKIFSGLDNLVFSPQNPNAMIMEANGYEILEWDNAVKVLMDEQIKDESIFSKTEKILTTQNGSLDFWGGSYKTKNPSLIDWKSVQIFEI
jgi:hypothetical protein